MKRLVIPALSLLFITGCSTPTVTKYPLASGGSKNDGVIEVSYNYILFENYQVDSEHGKIEAIERCKLWGYSGAESFGGEKTECSFQPRSMCQGWKVTTTYQCLD